MKAHISRFFSENAEGGRALSLLRRRQGRDPAHGAAAPAKVRSIRASCLACDPASSTAYRAHGPYEPEKGHRFNPNKLLLDPYAREVSGQLVWDDALWGYDLLSQDDLTFDERDSAPFMVKSVVQDPDFDWEDDKGDPPSMDGIDHLRSAMNGAHHDRIPTCREVLRGTYAGMVSDPIIAHLKKLGRDGRRAAALPVLPRRSHAARSWALSITGAIRRSAISPPNRASCAKVRVHRAPSGSSWTWC